MRNWNIYLRLMVSNSLVLFPYFNRLPKSLMDCYRLRGYLSIWTHMSIPRKWRHRIFHKHLYNLSQFCPKLIAVSSGWTCSKPFVLTCTVLAQNCFKKYMFCSQLCRLPMGCYLASLPNTVQNDGFNSYTYIPIVRWI